MLLPSLPPHHHHHHHRSNATATTIQAAAARDTFHRRQLDVHDAELHQLLEANEALESRVDSVRPAYTPSWFSLCYVGWSLCLSVSVYVCP